MTDQTQSQNEGYIRPPGPDPRVTAKHWFQYAALRVLGFLVSFLPMFVAQAFGFCIGLLFYKISKRHRKIALLNLDQAFGDQKSEQEKRRIARNCFLHFGRAALEILRAANLNERNFLKWVELENVGQFYKGLEGGKGVILCSAHYGNWEIMNLALGYLRLPMSVMARPIDNPLVHRFLERIRTHSGNRVIYKHKSVRKLLSTLKENRIVGIVNDQDVHDHNRIVADFFGFPAATTPVPAAIAIKTGAPIVTGYAVPLGRGRYLLRFGDLIHPDPKAEKDVEIARITRLLNQRLESQIMFKPSYWMWLHQRFKTGEDGLTGFYDRERDA